jgi:hypothetical protein
MSDAINLLDAALKHTTCKTVRLDGEWYFDFENGSVLRVGCLWRITVEGHVALTDSDHEQQFGLPAPIDAAHEAMRLVLDKRIVSVELDPGTADLYIEFEDGSELNVMNSSSGYEPWEFTSKKLRLVATPPGKIAIWK